MAPPQYNRYSQNAKRALVQGHFLARRYGHSEVDTDHLFAGILNTAGCLGWRILNDLGVDSQQVIEDILILHPATHPDAERLPFSHALRMSLITAVAEAQSLDSDYIGTEHILLGLIRSGNGQLRMLLEHLGITTEQIRGRIKRLVQQGISEITMEAMRRMAKLSELGKRVLNATEQIADSYDHGAIVPQHLLLALTQERRSIAKRLLTTCHCDVEQLKIDIPGLSTHTNDATSLVDRILDRAVDRAEAMGSHYTGTEHILLSMTLNVQTRQLLQSYGVDIGCLQQLLYEALTR